MNPKLKPIRDQVVVLMGATSGIGLETAKMMAEKGARVVILGRSQEGLNDALEQVRAHMAHIWSQMERLPASGDESGDFYSEPAASAGTVSAPVVTLEDQVIALEADATNFEQLKSAADQVIQRFGRIDTWVNISGVSEYALFEDTSPDEFHRVIEVNLLGQSYGAMAALPYLKQQPSGALIFMSSLGSRVPFPYQAAYNASKHGILGLADTLRLELKYTGIPVSVTTIIPSSINTPMFEKARTKIGVEPKPYPPVYDTRMAAKAIIYAAQHPVRELIVGDAGYMMNFFNRLAPTLTSNIIGATSFRAQRSDRIKSAQAPDNLYQHVPGYDEAQGDYSAEAMHFSPITWLSTHPMARNAIYATLLAGLGVLAGWRIVEERNRRRSWRYRLPRMINKYSRQASKQAMKTTQQTWKQARGALASAPVVSNLPMFRKRSMFQRSSDMLLGIWAALTSISLPFIRRRSMPRRMAARVADVSSNIADRMPSVRMRMPWNRQPSMAERIAMVRQRRAMARRLNKMSAKMMKQATEQMEDTRKQAAKVAEKARMQAKETSKQAQKSAQKTARFIKEQAQSKNDAKDGEVVVRRQTLIERLPFGVRRETDIEKRVVEKLPVKK